MRNCTDASSSHQHSSTKAPPSRVARRARGAPCSRASRSRSSRQLGAAVGAAAARRRRRRARARRRGGSRGRRRCGTDGRPPRGSTVASCTCLRFASARSRLFRRVPPWFSARLSGGIHGPRAPRRRAERARRRRTPRGKLPARAALREAQSFPPASETRAHPADRSEGREHEHAAQAREHPLRDRAHEQGGSSQFCESHRPPDTGAVSDIWLCRLAADVVGRAALAGRARSEQMEGSTQVRSASLPPPLSPVEARQVSPTAARSRPCASPASPASPAAAAARAARAARPPAPARGARGRGRAAARRARGRAAGRRVGRR